MAAVRRAIRIARATTNPVPARLFDLPEDVLSADASGEATSEGHAAWRQVAEVVDDIRVIDAVDDHVVALLFSAVNLGILDLEPDVHARLADRFEREVRPGIDAEIDRRSEHHHGSNGDPAVFTSNVRDHVWLYQTTRIAAALDPSERVHLEQTLPAVIGVGLRAYTERARDASRSPAHLAGSALVALALGGALYQAVAAQAVDPASMTALVGSLAAVTAVQARKVHVVRSSGATRAHERDAMDTRTAGEAPVGSLARLREDIEARRVAVRRTVAERESVPSLS